MKFIYFLIAVLALMALLANRGVHRSLMDNAIAAEALRDAAALPVNERASLLLIYATMPAEQRAVIEKVCTPIHTDYVNLAGSSASLPANRAPGCQALFRAGWSPAWTIQSSL
ncbi:MAG: hypothetical protein ISN26_07830 [Betaproteobacteria bacterium AqS2]|uniref:Uncharacterized protein n=1 Tax=Candidatus Amphirhobacter heronislandensis TaxID=1732024 RepID=A0A930XYP4_9GAMM|nr:hypothetical protein [Betaproteobacteria bacterium AqS2]